MTKSPRSPPGTVKEKRLLALVGYRRNLGFGIRIQVGPALLNRLQILVQLVIQRNPGRNIQTRNILITDLIQVLYNCAQRVTVCGNKYRLAALEFRNDFLFPIGQQAL